MTVPAPLPDWLSGARRSSVLTGVGISIDRGIPDYGGPEGLWTRDPDAERRGRDRRRLRRVPDRGHLPGREPGRRLPRAGG